MTVQVNRRSPITPNDALMHIVWLLMAFMLTYAPTALAHRASDAYLDVRSTPITGAPSVSPRAGSGVDLQLAIALRDLDLALPIDADANASITWGEVDAALPDVLRWVNSAARLDGCTTIWQFAGLERRSDGAYVVLTTTPICAKPGPIVLRYDLFKDLDATHRLVVTGRVNEQDILVAASPGQVGGVVLPTSAVAQEPSRWKTLLSYLLVGAHHLLEGYDHMAFLLALVLPLSLSLRSVLDASAVHKGQRWGPWTALLLTVTAFTVGHSITLALAVFGIIGPPPEWVEPMIAVSIGVSALLNLFPLKWVRGVHLAFAFGLIHGLAFAGLLIEAAAPPGLLPWALAGFNVGVEVGQLVAVGAWVLLSQPFVHRPSYSRWVVPSLSVLMVGLSVHWFLQRI